MFSGPFQGFDGLHQYDLDGINCFLIAIGFVVSVLSNFILNDIWTFNPRFGKPKKEIED